jgi:hypothetical protein
MPKPIPKPASVSTVTVKRVSKVCVSFELDEADARTLLGWMQNPLDEREPGRERRLRERIFRALQAALQPPDLLPDDYDLPF